MILSALIPAAALAGTAPAKKPAASGFSGKGQFGLLDSQGNAQARSANAVIDIAYITGHWKHALHASMLYGQSAGIVSAERWDVAWQSNDHITPNFFVFGALRYERDMFDGFVYQGNGALGVGYHVIHTKSATLSIQLGAGYMLSRPEIVQILAPGVVSRAPQSRRDYAIASGGLDYEQQLSGTTMLTDKFLVNTGGFNTLFVNDLALTVKVSTQLAVSLGYNIQDNTHPPGKIKNLDTTETVNLVYAF